MTSNRTATREATIPVNSPPSTHLSRFIGRSDGFITVFSTSAAIPIPWHCRCRNGIQIICTKMTILPGNPYPLGATWDGKGVNFALYSHNATKVELCLFDVPKGKKESQCITFTQRA